MEYESMVSYIYNKSKPMSVDDVELLCLARESRLCKLSKKSLGAVNLIECNPNSTPNFQSQISAGVNSDPQSHPTQVSNDAADNYNNSGNNSGKGGGQNLFCGCCGGGCGHGGVTENLQMFSVKSAINLVMKHPFVIIGMMKIMLLHNL